MRGDTLTTTRYPPHPSTEGRQEKENPTRYPPPPRFSPFKTARKMKLLTGYPPRPPGRGYPSPKLPRP